MNFNFIKLFKGIVFAILLCLTFLVIDYFQKYPVDFSSEFDSCSIIWQKFNLLHKSPSIAIAIWFLMTWAFYQNFLYVKKIFLEFIFPLAIVAFTLATGTFGFHQSGFNWTDSFFASANLLTLNTSVFETFLTNGHKINYWIENARITGGIFLAYAFFWALFSATGRENTSRIRFWWYRQSWRKKPFVVVIGDGNKAVVLALDLEKQGKRVAFLNQGFGENIEGILEEKTIWYLKGNASSKFGLTKTFFQEAIKVYVLNGSDEENFRTIQEMNEIVEKNNYSTDVPWFVHLKDLRQKALLSNFVVPRYIQTFDIFQNTARRILAEHPIDRFSNGSSIAHIVLIGFGDLAQAIAMQCLRIGHFTGNKTLQIKVYYTPEEKQQVDFFKESHPELFKYHGVFGSDADAHLVQHYTFFQHNERIIDFELLPIAESDMVSPEFSLYELIQPQNCISIYACLPSGLEAASLLGSVLPRIAWQKSIGNTTCDVQVFCHYNFPDVEEEKTVQKRLNELTQNQVEVFCIGNYLDECTVKAIENVDVDMLAKQIALMYDKVHGNNNPERIEHAKEVLKKWDKSDLESNWKKIKEIDRESNRQAADHAAVKFREFSKDPNNLPENLENYWGNDLPLLAELEHRRWNAEKLLLGWLPTSEETLWNNGYKNAFRSQKLHYHLMDFDTLPDDQKDKDYTQVMGLPYFMRELYKP